MAENIVKVGQVWEDCDKRSKGRRLKILRLFTRIRSFSNGTHEKIPYAKCEVLSGSESLDALRREQNAVTTTKIRINRFKPGSSGYRLISEASPVLES